MQASIDPQEGIILDEDGFNKIKKHVEMAVKMLEFMRES